MPFGVKNTPKRSSTPHKRNKKRKLLRPTERHYTGVCQEVRWAQ
jgi:hypothetical protein